MSDASELIKSMMTDALAILTRSQGTTRLETFAISASGHMPCRWQIGQRGHFNPKTYEWIESALKPGSSPIEHSGKFFNQYRQVLENIGFKLSNSDQAKLIAADEAARDQRNTLIRIWQEETGVQLPQDTEAAPMKEIIRIVKTTWSDSNPTLEQIRRNRRVLNTIPDEHRGLKNVFLRWLRAMGDSERLTELLFSNEDQLEEALDAVRNPSEENGGIILFELIKPGDEDKPKRYVRNFPVTTSVERIIQGLKDERNIVRLPFQASTDSRSSGDYRITFEQAGSQTTIDVPKEKLIKITLNDDNSDIANEIISANSSGISISFLFPGVTHVSFGPMEYSHSTGKGWYWIKPITDSINNTNKDVSSFKFKLNQPDDFSESGSFGFLEGVVISNYPTVEIRIPAPNAGQIVESIEEARININMFGMPISGSDGQHVYGSSAIAGGDDMIIIRFFPLERNFEELGSDLKGWVLGVQPEFPAAAAAAEAAKEAAEAAEVAALRAEVSDLRERFAKRG